MDDLLKTDEGEKAVKDIQAKEGNPDPFSGAAMSSESIVNFVGCTATVVLVTKTDIYCANAGDSRTVLGRV